MNDSATLYVEVKDVSTEKNDNYRLKSLWYEKNEFHNVVKPLASVFVPTEKITNWNAPFDDTMTYGEFLIQKQKILSFRHIDCMHRLDAGRWELIFPINALKDLTYYEILEKTKADMLLSMPLDRQLEIHRSYEHAKINVERYTGLTSPQFNAELIEYLHPDKLAIRELNHTLYYIKESDAKYSQIGIGGFRKQLASKYKLRIPAGLITDEIRSTGEFLLLHIWQMRVMDELRKVRRSLASFDISRNDLKHYYVPSWGILG